MPRSTFSDAYALMLSALIDARQRAGLSQTELAERLGKPQPFISKVERGVRRIDVIEFAVIAQAMGADPIALFSRVVKRLPRGTSI